MTAKSEAKRIADAWLEHVQKQVEMSVNELVAAAYEEGRKAGRAEATQHEQKETE